MLTSHKPGFMLSLWWFKEICASIAVNFSFCGSWATNNPKNNNKNNNSNKNSHSLSAKQLVRRVKLKTTQMFVDRRTWRQKTVMKCSIVRLQTQPVDVFQMFPWQHGRQACMTEHDCISKRSRSEHGSSFGPGLLWTFILTKNTKTRTTLLFKKIKSHRLNIEGTKDGRNVKMLFTWGRNCCISFHLLSSPFISFHRAAFSFC